VKQRKLVQDGYAIMNRDRKAGGPFGDPQQASAGAIPEDATNILWIKENAYYRWVNDDRRHGHHLRHWTEAEKAFAQRGIAMSASGSDAGGVSTLVYVLPRIRLVGTAFGQERFTIARANFLPDEPKSWAEVLQLPRPEWLDIYRQFPGLHSDEPPAPARGTLIVSDDEDWLRKQIARLIAVVYILGLDESRWRVPADAFQYSSFKATEKPHDLVITPANKMIMN
jgi:hypothetical protein